MNYNDAVAVYQKSPTSATLKEVCKQLCSEMTLREKLKMLSGRQFAMRNCYDLLTKGRKYNYRPCIAGGIKRLEIPTVAFSDGPRGVVMGKSTCFPVSMARGASFNDELEYEVGTAIAKEVIAGGANYFAGICINLLRNPRWGRAQETYGEDPFLLGKMGAALTKAVQDNGVIACPKHFACNSIENIRFSVDVHADEKTLQEVYFPHFKKCIDAGAMSIMGAYNLLRGEHCCESKYLFTDVLRDQWHFEGFAITDFLFALRNGERAVKADMDVEMPMKILYTMLRDGETDKLNAFLTSTAKTTRLREGKLAEAPLRQAKNLLIGIATMVGKVGAIGGGLGVEETYRLIDLYIQECEKTSSTEEVKVLQYNMLLDFTDRVAQVKAPRNASKEIYACMQYIQNHTNCQIGIDDVAEFIGKSRTYVTKKFRQETGESITDFIIKSKIRDAKRLLRYSNRSLSEISTHLCFSSQAYFQTVFKKSTGMTPNEYRNVHNEK